MSSAIRAFAVKRFGETPIKAQDLRYKLYAGDFKKLGEYDNLPPKSEWPEFVFDLPELKYPGRMNCATELLDKPVTRGYGHRIALRTADGDCTYTQFFTQANRLANVLVMLWEGATIRMQIDRSLQPVDDFLAFVFDSLLNDRS